MHKCSGQLETDDGHILVMARTKATRSSQSVLLFIQGESGRSDEPQVANSRLVGFTLELYE